MDSEEIIGGVNSLSVGEDYLCTRKYFIEGKYFSAEETICSSKVSVTVEGVGKLNFPLDKTTVKRLLNVSTEAELDTSSIPTCNRSIYKTQMIAESKLKVELDEEIFTEVLSKIASQLKIDENYKLVPHLHNMVIHEGNGVFDRDMEKLDCGFASLVLVLPSCFKATFNVRHLRSCKSFICSSDLNFINCIAFYSDCFHCFRTVREEYCVLLSYNIELKGPELPIPTDVSIVNAWHNSIAQYFITNKQSKYLILHLTHLYSEDSLKWHKLKGKDRIIAWAMFAVAKKQKLTPYLALSYWRRTWETNNDVSHMSFSDHIISYHWLDENNMPCDRDKHFDVNSFISKSDSSSSPPYKVIDDDWMDEPNARGHWCYRFSYIVLIKE